MINLKSFFPCILNPVKYLTRRSFLQKIFNWVLNAPLYFEMHRSSFSQMFFKIGVLKNFAIFTTNTCVGVSF